MLVPYGLPNVVYAVDGSSSTAAVSTSEGGSPSSGEGSDAGEHASSNDATAPDSGTGGAETDPGDGQNTMQPSDGDEIPDKNVQPGDSDETPGENVQPGDSDEAPDENAQPDDGTQIPDENAQPEKPEQSEPPAKQGGAAAAEKQLLGPLSLTTQSVTVKNIHHGTAPDGYSAVYEVTLTVDGVPYTGEYEYEIDGDSHTYSTPFSLSLDAGETKTITLENDETVQAQVRQTSVTGSSVLLNADEQSLAMDTSGTLTFVYSPEQIFYVDVNWNDNRATDRPARGDIALTLWQSADGGTTYTPTSITPTDVPGDTSSYNTWTYTYAAPAYDADGNMLTYTVRQPAVVHYRTDDAVESTDGGGNTRYTIVNTRLIDLTFDVVWQDNGNTYGTRPGVEQYSGGLVLYCDGTALDRIADAAVYDALTVTANPDGKTWTVSFKDLPEYDADGIPYTYKAVQGSVAADNAHWAAAFRSNIRQPTKIRATMPPI